ncbi:hypothetical protein PG993_000882 [Apiospora rasikravindrae]|uniref:Uncharacterized protein n=1 Tax=Apiospora rasikravindrae TaxID=990691 RepID=A0ABR1UC30_9PEZI
MTREQRLRGPPPNRRLTDHGDAGHDGDGVQPAGRNTRISAGSRSLHMVASTLRLRAGEKQVPYVTRKG